MDMLLLKREDVVFVVDELERSLHPKLTEHFLELFSELHRERKTQLIFTTHEASIMDQFRYLKNSGLGRGYSYGSYPYIYRLE